MPGWLSGLLALIPTILKAVGLYKVKQAGKTEAERDAAERELEAIDDARAARAAVDDPGVRDELREYRERRDQR